MITGEALSGRPFDVIVIGGGINGAAIAREAAVRGLRVALFEQEDFGFGTTWRSTRLIHGGLRYLEHGELRLVRESLQERGRLLKERPHLVKPQRFVLPGGEFSRRPGWQVRLGLAAYDALALGGGLPGHRAMSADDVALALPGMGDGAPAGFSFFDARAVGPERLTLELVLEARAAGAVVANHTTVTGVRQSGGVVTGVTIDRAGERIDVQGHHVINAAGPWVDAVLEAAGEDGPRILGMTRGTHVAFELEGPLPEVAALSTAQSDGRVFFAVPHSGLVLVGTTDVRYDGDPGCVAPTRDEVDYLLREAQALLPRYDLTAGRVRYAYAGLRPLLASTGGPEAAITRRHAVIDHSRRGGPTGLYSVAGGKLSTFQPLARETLWAIGIGWGSNRATAAPRPLGEGTGLEGRVLAHLERYGHAAEELLHGAGKVLCPHAGAVTAEVAHAVQHEEAATLSDVLLRRMGVGWHSCRGLCCHQEAAGLMAGILDWDAEETARQVGAFEADVRKNLPTLDEVTGVR